MRPPYPLFAVLLAASCAADAAAPDCRRSSDCDAALCVGGRCEAFAGSTTLDGPRDGTNADRQPDAGSVEPVAGPCTDSTVPTAETLVLNEVLANVPSGPEGDANADGVRDAYEDEFVEIVNMSARPIDLAGVRIYAGGKLKHVFEPTCVLPGAAVVVFGGGSVGSTVPGNAVIADSRFAMPNDGGVVELAMPDGPLDRLAYDRAPAASLTRSPQLRGVEWVSHLELGPTPFSPGSCPDGLPLSGGCIARQSADAGTD